MHQTSSIMSVMSAIAPSSTATYRNGERTSRYDVIAATAPPRNDTLAKLLCSVGKFSGKIPTPSRPIPNRNIAPDTMTD